MPRILVVDDELGVHEMMRSLFATLEVEDEYVTNGADALERYQTGGFDVVLTDVRMEKMDGLELTRKLKAFDPAAVVVLMTAYDRKDDVLTALKLGVFDFFVKPFKINEFLGSVKRALRQRQVNLRIAGGDFGGSPAPKTTGGALGADIASREAAVLTREKAVAALEADLRRRDEILRKTEELIKALFDQQHGQ